MAADLIAGVGAAQDGGLTRVLVLRDLLLNADLQRPFDFVNAAQDVGPSYTAMVSDADPTATLDVIYTTRHEEGGMPMRQGPTTTPGAGTRMLTYASIPTALQRSDDSYLFRVRETVGNFGRTLDLRVNLAANQSFALPANFPVSFSMETQPYMRAGMDFAAYAGATRYVLQWGYFVAGEQHAFEVLVDADSLPAAAMHSVVFPDFAAVPGFNASWVPPTGTSETINLGATAQTYVQNASLERKTSASMAGSYRVVP